MHLSPFKTYCLYLALKSHFHTKYYDYFKYGGKVRADFDSFEKRNDKYYFTKLSKHKDIHSFLLANLIEFNGWVGELLAEEYEQKYFDWKKRRESISYIFKNELDKLDPNFDNNFTVDDSHPLLLKLYLSNSISLETLTILVDLTHCEIRWDKHLKDDLVWDDLRNKIIKYKPFMNYDKDKMKNIVIEKFKPTE